MCGIRFFDIKKVQEKFNIEENIIRVCLIPLGYKSEDCVENSLHNQRKNLNEIIEYI